MTDQCPRFLIFRLSESYMRTFGRIHGRANVHAGEYTQKKKTLIPPSGFRAHDPSVQVVEGSTWLRSHTLIDRYASKVMYCGNMYFRVLITDMIRL
jgi:hypothetical protein